MSNEEPQSKLHVVIIFVYPLIISHQRAVLLVKVRGERTL